MGEQENGGMTDEDKQLTLYIHVRVHCTCFMYMYVYIVHVHTSHVLHFRGYNCTMYSHQCS